MLLKNPTTFVVGYTLTIYNSLRIYALKKSLTLLIRLQQQTIQQTITKNLHSLTFD
jgi:hypothetical protein